jgi:hypothetical protein
MSKMGERNGTNEKEMEKDEGSGKCRFEKLLA